MVSERIELDPTVDTGELAKDLYTDGNKRTPGHGTRLKEIDNIVATDCDVRPNSSSHNFVFSVGLSSRNVGGCAMQLTDDLSSFVVAADFDKPTGRLRKELNSNKQQSCGEHLEANGDPPCGVRVHKLCSIADPIRAV